MGSTSKIALALASTVSLALALAGCGGQDSNLKGSTQNTTASSQTLSPLQSGGAVSKAASFGELVEVEAGVRVSVGKPQPLGTYMGDHGQPVTLPITVENVSEEEFWTDHVTVSVVSGGVSAPIVGSQESAAIQLPPTPVLPGQQVTLDLGCEVVDIDDVNVSLDLKGQNSITFR
ncbi:hypothetical protein [Gleimia europaea]|uniref:DUF4352 domain-containing protein n=1 Tax=Gleimia europaea ACS-120-V-Col10b TaxID=883069 RepID=A0A9W5RDB9_9ACTO|nr:hypothetical protein [Gleimia europaea]EPD30359.1 hypothetical protein HMPREF9238_00097 [Gleimia europaea ACS-120-V-Col10b]